MFKLSPGSIAFVGALLLHVSVFLGLGLRCQVFSAAEPSISQPAVNSLQVQLKKMPRTHSSGVEPLPSSRAVLAKISPPWQHKTTAATPASPAKKAARPAATKKPLTQKQKSALLNQLRQALVKKLQSQNINHRGKVTLQFNLQPHGGIHHVAILQTNSAALIKPVKTAVAEISPFTAAQHYLKYTTALRLTIVIV
jgi:hypothetical protein